MKISEMPKQETPYERFKIYGEQNLTDSELLSIIIKSGTKGETSIQIANKLIKRIEKLEELQYLSIEELEKIKGIGEIKAIEIKTCVELAKRIGKLNNIGNIKVKKSSDVAKIFLDELKFEKQEYIKLVMLNSKNIVEKISTIVKGETNCAYVTPIQILTEPVKKQIKKIILVHNHPSGDPTPSEDDIKLTKRIYNSSELMGISLLDHIIVAKDGYNSIMDKIK